jgi:hypothetical protein
MLIHFFWHDKLQITAPNLHYICIMRFNQSRLRQIFDRTSGYCHICHAKLDFNRYGEVGKAASWEVEHSTPQAKGGTHHLNNLYPACIACNRAKSDNSTRSARAKHGKKRAPLSVKKRQKAKIINGVKGSCWGVVATVIVSVDVSGSFIVLGLVLGYLLNPDKKIR